MIRADVRSLRTCFPSIIALLMNCRIFADRTVASVEGSNTVMLVDLPHAATFSLRVRARLKDTDLCSEFSREIYVQTS